jgi:hypothetical protein
MPLLFGLLAVGLALYEVQKRKQMGVPAAPPPAPLPPVNAPPAAIALYQQALSSNDPVQMVQIATALYGQGQPALAAAINQRYIALTNNPIPGIPMTAGVGAMPHARLDPHTVAVLANAARMRRARNVQLARSIAAARLRRTT